jgi:hypothetical protein
MSILGSYLVSKRELRRKLMCRKHVRWILEFNLRGSSPTKEFHLEPHHLSIPLVDV